MTVSANATGTPRPRRVRGSAPLRAARPRLAGRRPRALPAQNPPSQGRTPADRAHPPALEPLLVDYLRVRANDPEPALFVGVMGKRLSQTILTRTFLRYAQQPASPTASSHPAH